MANTISKKIATKLRETRETLGFSQDEVANRLNKPQSYVSRCENGTRRVDVSELIGFAKIYEKPLAYFLDGLLD